MDQSVTITVNPSGGLEDIRFSARAGQLGPARLASVVVDTYAKACAEAARNTLEIMSGLVGGDSGAMEFLRSTMPAVDPPGTSDNTDDADDAEGW